MRVKNYYGFNQTGKVIGHIRFPFRYKRNLANTCYIVLGMGVRNVWNSWSNLQGHL